MQKLGVDVIKHISSIPAGQARDDEIQRLAIEMLNAIKEFHSMTNSTQNNISTDHFLMQGKRLCMISFGLTSSLISQGSHIEMQRDIPLVQNFRYASHWAHEGLSSSRRDDIEMLCYVILRMLKPNPQEELWR